MADEDYINTDVYRERDTGKIRIKGQTRIEPLAESPTTAGDTKINEILAMLEAAGLNPET
jgi:hypothetical protein